MAMKKKFLGLALATAIALPATTAYADRVNIADTQTHTQNVTVSGSVNKGDGTAAAGRIEVELPTTLSFSVDKNGGVQGANYEVTNYSSVPVTVAVQSFEDTTPTEGDKITVKQESEIDEQKDRSYVSLKLVGTPVLGGGQTEVDLALINQGGDDILQVAPNGKKGVINLNGIAGTKEAQNGVDKTGASDTFNLVFNVRANN